MNPEPYEGDKYEPFAEGETAADYNRRVYPDVIDRLDRLSDAMGLGTGEIKTQREVPLAMVTGRAASQLAERLGKIERYTPPTGPFTFAEMAAESIEHQRTTEEVFRTVLGDYSEIEKRALANYLAEAMANDTALLTTPVHHMQGTGADGYKKTHSLFDNFDTHERRYFLLKDFDMPAPEEKFSGDEQHEADKRRRMGKHTHKDKRLESRDAKQAMIDRALAKMKKGKR